MSLQVTDEWIISTATAETARYRAVAAKRHGSWTVSWLPHRLFDRHEAITAITLAETLAAGVRSGHPRWPVVESMTHTLGITPTEAVERYAARLKQTLFPAPTVAQHEALQRLMAAALGSSAQALSVANFLLAWWNADECGGFDFRDVWGLDPQIDADLRVVFALILDTCAYPDTLGYEAHFQRLVALWRPGLTSAPHGRHGRSNDPASRR